MAEGDTRIVKETGKDADGASVDWYCLYQVLAGGADDALIGRFEKQADAKAYEQQVKGAK